MFACVSKNFRNIVCPSNAAGLFHYDTFSSIPFVDVFGIIVQIIFVLTQCFIVLRVDFLLLSVNMRLLFVRPLVRSFICLFVYLFVHSFYDLQ